MIIAQISDTHIAMDLADSNVRRQDLERTIADINELDPLPDAIVHTGDIAQHGRLEEYQIVEAALAKACAQGRPRKSARGLLGLRIFSGRARLSSICRRGSPGAHLPAGYNRSRKQ